MLALVIIATTTAAQAQPNKELYELQERCGKQASKMFKADNPTGQGGTATEETKDGMIIVTYENHYSGKLNKCFYLQIRQYINKKPPPEGPTFMDLFDLNENKNYGNLMKWPAMFHFASPHPRSMLTHSP